MTPDAGARPGARRFEPPPWLLALLLTALALAAFSPLLSAGFINYDDQVYVSENPRVQGGLTWDNARWAFTTLYFGFYYPLTWLSHMLDCEIYGLWAGGHHLTSVLLHAASAAVLLLALVRMTRAVWRSAVVAALFALHPLHVESVAWISERKDVLSTFFLMLMLLAYARYAESPSVRRYLPVLALFLGGLMAKSMIATAPLLLLLLDVWPLGRWGSAAAAGQAPSARRALFLEKLPLFALAGLFAALTLLGQRRIEALSTLEALPIGIRIQNAVVALAGYLCKAVVPARLALPYPYETHGLPLSQVVLSAFLVAAVAFLALASIRRRPYVFVGAAWFTIALLPVIGILQFGNQSSADRYTYVSLIGLFIAATWWLADLASGSGVGRAVLAAAATALLILFGTLTWRQARYWHDSISLFGHAVAVTRNNALAHANLGAALMAAGRIDEAEKHFKTAIEIKPDLADVWGGLGDLFEKQGKAEAAQKCYERVLLLQPANAKALNQEGVLLERQGRTEEALEKYRSSGARDPLFLPARFNLVRLLLETGDTPAAVKESREIARIAPASSRAQYLLGKSLALEGHDEEAFGKLKRATELDPVSVEARVQLGLLFARRGMLAEAGSQMQAATKLSPEDPDIRYLFAKIQLASGDKAGAAGNLREALRLRPGWPEAQRLLSDASSGVGGG